ncbi:hypothetical protein HZA43_00845 [Candidatus Peregrinibacteria bacterium]|nr:hypothetical protein [Candidatus Peregrinibacteria bacterium]
MVKALNPSEAVPELKGLARFKAQYEALERRNPSGVIWRNLGGVTWQEVETRLLANDSHFLKLAEAMAEGGILFGVDKDKNPLIADGGEEPILCGMNYADTRKTVIFSEVTKIIDGKMQEMQIPTGYEMFPYSGNSDKSIEICTFEDVTNNPFIYSKDKKHYRASYLESGDNPPHDVWVACFNRGDSRVVVGHDSPNIFDPRCGVRRLLRVKKAA